MDCRPGLTSPIATVQRHQEAERVAGRLCCQVHKSSLHLEKQIEERKKTKMLCLVVVTMLVSASLAFPQKRDHDGHQKEFNGAGALSQGLNSFLPGGQPNFNALQGAFPGMGGEMNGGAQNQMMNPFAGFQKRAPQNADKRLDRFNFPNNMGSEGLSALGNFQPSNGFQGQGNRFKFFGTNHQ